MEIKFDELDYQLQAVESSVNIFEGQTIRNSEFTVSAVTDAVGTMFAEDGIGIANRIHINPETMLNNVRKVQIKNGIAPSDNLLGNDYTFPMFNTEMETGTGKTYVYFKTILELYEKHGFLKFIIVVPSVAIKEGVLKTFEMIKETFSKNYQGVVYDLFPYDSSNLDRIRQFATANTIDIMVITMDSFNKKSEAGAIRNNKGNTNVIYRQSDQIGGERAIDLIAETRPFLIIDEPQVVDNTRRARDSIARLNPSVGFRYSATHKDKSFPTIYRLGAVEAYEEELVKQIEVASINLEEDGNKAHLKLQSVENKNGQISAQIEVYKKTKEGAVKDTIKFRQGDNVATKTKLQVYEKVGIIQDIDSTLGQEAVFFEGEPSVITLSSAAQEDLELKRLQIRRTIKAHLDKESRLLGQGIKVLSLFFLDQVSNYRIYTKEGYEKGRYAQIFEEEYESLILLPEYSKLKDKSVPVDEVHDGYFAKDNKGQYKDSKTGTAKADESTYEIIMRDKEGLLTQYDLEKRNDTRAHKIRFIFSHSALKEGWDNPNVFQICTLVDTKDELTKRQKIGRGLRIGVNQDGKRVPGFDVNTLTLIANESYEDFARELQTEYEEDGVVFGVFEDDSFATIILSYDPVSDEYDALGKEQSKRLVKEMQQNGYIDNKRHATDKLRLAIKNDDLQLSKEFEDIKKEVLEVASKKVRTLQIKNADEKTPIKVNKEALSEDFLALWEKIKHKTTYRVNFDTEQLIQNVLYGTSYYPYGVKAIKVDKPSYTFKLGKLQIADSGIEGVEESNASYETPKEIRYELPDIITFLQNETKLTRNTITTILAKVGNLDQFKINPLSYMNKVANIINLHKRYLTFDGLEYRKIENDYYEQSLFTDETLEAYLDKDFKVDTTKNKTTHDYVKVDSNIEREFAKDAELDESIKYYIKLPSEFKIRTPLGNYNPDWAIVKEENNNQRLYFVIETKGSIDPSQLRVTESLKINAGKKHFKAVDTGVTFKKATDLKEL